MILETKTRREMDKEILIELLTACSLIMKEAGLLTLSRKIMSATENPEEEELLSLYDEIEKWMGLGRVLKNKVIEFGNESSYSMIKYFIVTYERDYNDDGRPIIIINRLADSSDGFKDNPIKNLYLIYDDEEERDRDFEKIKITLK